VRTLAVADGGEISLTAEVLGKLKEEVFNICKPKGDRVCVVGEPIE
jgi:hypothetical protein